MFQFVNSKMFTEQRDWLIAKLGEKKVDEINSSLTELFGESTKLARKFELAKKGPQQLVSFIRKLRKQLDSVVTKGPFDHYFTIFWSEKI